MREISLFSDITPVIVMPSNWIRFVHPRKTAGISLNIRRSRLAAEEAATAELGCVTNLFRFVFESLGIFNDEF